MRALKASTVLKFCQICGNIHMYYTFYYCGQWYRSYHCRGAFIILLIERNYKG